MSRHFHTPAGPNWPSRANAQLAAGQQASQLTSKPADLWALDPIGSSPQAPPLPQPTQA